MPAHRISLASILVCCLTCTGCFNADPAKKLTSMPQGTGFVLRSVKNDTGNHKYSIFIPRDYNASRKYPTVVFLHGIGEAGSDGKKCTTVGIGPAIAKRNGEFPFIVLFPQAGWDWTTDNAGKLAIDVLKDAEKDYAIDTDRVTLTGMSSGGKGTWVLGARYAETWNALVPMGGYAAADTVPTLVKTKMPIWALHNSGDFIVPVGGTKSMIKKLEAAGGHPKVTIYSASGHNCWDAAYDSGELFAWLQQQRRSQRSSVSSAMSSAMSR